MDGKRSILNVTFSLCSQIIIYICTLIVRRLLIQHIGNDINGLNSLYTSIIGMIAVVELGIGSAITYSMYKPIVAGDNQQVAALFRLNRKLYFIIGIVILCVGMAVIPFLPKLISDYDSLNVNVYQTFFLMLISVVLTYYFGAEISLIQAFKENYITIGILTISRLISNGLQILSIILWQSFTLYLVCQIIETLIIWLLTEIVVQKKYKEIINSHIDLDQNTRIEVIKNTKAMFMHKIGTVLVNTIDSIIISTFIGVVILGKYTNYTLIAGVVASLITLFFTPVTSVVGHLYVGVDREKTKLYFDHFYSANFILGVVFFLGYFAVIDYAVKLCFGPGLELSRSIAFIITLNQFIKYMRNAVILFRDASGTFYYDRWKPIGEGIANLVLSLFFVQVFPENLRIVGVIVATIITTLFICHIVDPYVVFRHAFNVPVKEYYIRNYSYIGLFTLALILMTYLTRPASNPIIGILSNGLISIGVSLVALGFVAIVDKTFRAEVCTMGRKAVEWSGRVLHG